MYFWYSLWLIAALSVLFFQQIKYFQLLYSSWQSVTKLADNYFNNKFIVINPINRTRPRSEVELIHLSKPT